MTSMPWGKRVFIIAEAGVNHNGSLATAKKMIDAACRAGADAIKFQTWKNEEIITRDAGKVDYINKATDSTRSLWEILESLALSHANFRKLRTHARKKGILFLSTPDGFASLDFLADELNLPIIKIGSTEVTHLRYLKAIAAKRRPIILSTGLSNLGEVERAIDLIRSQYGGPIVLLHCNSAYPTPPEDVNLRAMTTLAQAFRLPVGLSDHTLGNEAAIAAVALGARVVEKHFTLDKSMQGPDHEASLDARELAAFVQSIRRTEQMLGDGIKRARRSELRNIEGVRRSVVAVRKLPKGTQLTADLLICKRPGGGISPVDLDKILGFKVNAAIEQDEQIMWKHLK